MREQVNKFEQVSSVGHQVSLAGRMLGAVAGGKGPISDVQNGGAGPGPGPWGPLH